MQNNNHIVEFYTHTWNKQRYQDAAQECFELVDSYLDTPPKRILDIGCGFAYVSEQFQKKYGTELYFLEGDFNSTTDRPRKSGWGDVDDMKFYLPLADLKQYWDLRNIKYNFIDANDIRINQGITFDFVCSWLSCGYHYPASTYKNLIGKHTNDESKIIFDFRTKTLHRQQSDEVEVIHNLNNNKGSKGKTCHVHFKFK
jgi:SAM-dependent methyltransferase